jgi:hypothetical protein
MPRPSSTWYWDEGSSSAGEYNWRAYDAETSKKIEKYYQAMGPDRFECDVGGGRVVTQTRKGLVQHVKGEPGRWRAVRREVHGPGATHSPAPPPSHWHHAAQLQQLQVQRFRAPFLPSAVTSGRPHHSLFGLDAPSDDDFEDDKASKAFKQKRAAARSQICSQAASSAAGCQAPLLAPLLPASACPPQIARDAPSHPLGARTSSLANRPTAAVAEVQACPEGPPLAAGLLTAATQADLDAYLDAVLDDEDEDDDDADADVAISGGASSIDDGPEFYMVCNDKVWEVISTTAGAAGMIRVALACEHASFFSEEDVEAVSLFDKIGTNVFVEFARDQGARLVNKGFAQMPPECPHAKVEHDVPTRLYFDSSASQVVYEPALAAVNAAAQKAGFLRHKPFTLTAMPSGSSHTIHVDPRALFGLTSLQQKKVKDPVQAVLSAERFAELNEIILQTSGATVFGFGVIDRCKLNLKSAQHKKKVGLQGFKDAAVMIIRVPGDTLAFSPRLAAGGCSSLSVEGGVCRFVAACGSEPTIIAHAAEPLASCGELPSAVRASLLAAMPQAHCDSILMMNRFNGQVARANDLVRKLRAALADANLASSVAVPAGPFDRANTPWQAAALCAMLHAPTEVNVLRCLAGGALKHVGFSLEHMRANHERMRSTQHGEATKVGMANVAASDPAARLLMDTDASLSASAALTKAKHAELAATNPAARLLMDADASLSASAALTKAKHAELAATNPAARLLMDADASLSASAALSKAKHAELAATNPAVRLLMAADASRSAAGAVTKVGHDSIKRATEDEWAKRQRQEAALGPAFANSSVAKHLFR